MKWKYGSWVDDIPIIEQNQEVTLASNWDAGDQAVRVRVAESDNEYFIIEYRRKQGLFDSQLPMSGLLVYRINPQMEGGGNMNGPPDEVYVFRPGGTDTENGMLKQAPLRPDRRNLMNEMTDPFPALGDGTPVTLRIYDIGEMGDTITFKVSLVDPGCGEKVCGTDGMGGWCGDCPEQNWCSAGACTPCTCDGRECGANECGVSCGTCDDGNQCTTDTCEEFQCVFEVAAGNPCDDGEACTKDDICGSDGACSGDTYACEPGACEQTSACDGEGGCTPTFVAEGTPCEPDIAGQCQTAACDGAGTCAASPAAAGTACDDGDAATDDDRCDDDGTCVGRPAEPADVIGDIGSSDAIHGDVAEKGDESADENRASGGCTLGSSAGGTSMVPILLVFGGIIALTAGRRVRGFKR
jgi:hypothetical protein